MEAEDDGSSSFPPATHARTYVRTSYVRTYVFSVRTHHATSDARAGLAALTWLIANLRWPGRLVEKNAEILPSLTHPHVHGAAHNTFPFGAPIEE